MDAPSSKASPQTEAELTQVVAEFLTREGFVVRAEVPNLGQSVDLVATHEHTLMLVEVKKSNWRRALKQCRAHHMVADYICIAIGQSKVSLSLQKEAELKGYGIIHCSPHAVTCSWIASPTRLFDFWNPERNRITTRLENIPTYARPLDDVCDLH